MVQDAPMSIPKPIRPVEFSLGVAVPVVTLFIALIVTLSVIFAKAHANGTDTSTT
jgi:hypothetical protein